jgi:hypothetical protein
MSYRAMPSPCTIAATLTCSFAAVGCSDRAADSVQLVSGLIEVQRLYSAYDGEHDYRVVARVDRTVADLSFLHWTTDSAFVERLWDPGVPGAVLLTTKRTGTTHIELLAETADDQRVRSEATLEISQASSDEWARGDEYWGRPRVLADFVERPTRPPVCGLPADTFQDTSCLNCHTPLRGDLAARLDATPYSDERLIATFAQGEFPLGGVTDNEFLRQVPDPDCAFKQMHNPIDLDEETTRGLVWKMRSLEP